MEKQLSLFLSPFAYFTLCMFLPPLALLGTVLPLMLSKEFVLCP